MAGEKEDGKSMRRFTKNAVLKMYDVKRIMKRVLDDLEKCVEEDEESDLTDRIMKIC